ncbi:MAG: ATP synthase F1 subunit delta [Planctomycetes bacterium]|nr:ATP synthase F1 subunit delta [Planctomycetota bacterium]
MIDRTLATGYLQALLWLAKDKDQLEEVTSDLDTVADVFEENKKLRKIFLHPSVTQDEKTRLVKGVFAPFVSTLVRNFLLLLITKRREGILDDLLEQYQAVADLVGGRSRATVTTAIPLTEDRLASIKKTLEGITNRTVKVNARVDPEILGGVIVKMGNKIIDGSVVARLKKLRKQLVEVGIS